MYKDNYKSYKYNSLLDMLAIIENDLTESAYKMLRVMLTKKIYSKKTICRMCKIYNYQFDANMAEIQKTCKPFADMF